MVVAACVGAIVALLLVLLLRPDRTPARIELAGLPQVILDYGEVKAEASVLNKKGEHLANVPITYAAEPASIVATGLRGGLTCLKRGEGTLVATAGGKSERAQVRCRPVARLTESAEITLALTAKATKVDIAALDKDGEKYADVPLSMQTSDPAVFRIEETRIAPVGLGSATLTVSAGAQSAKIAVTVVDNTLFQKFTLADGETRSFQVAPPGRYHVRVKAQGGDPWGAGVELSFAVSTCEARPEAAIHDVECDFGNGGSVTVTNPPLFGRWSGIAVQVRLSLDRKKSAPVQP
ncbi:MAG: hypothetical protein WCE40_06675 [Polyangia bacterium]